MITLITGGPGAGKTACLVDMLVGLSRSRPLFVHHLDGLMLDHVPLDQPDKWHELVPVGGVAVFDEVQRAFRPRGSGAAVPPAVAAFETHRHEGVDVFMTTLHPGLLDSNIRKMVTRHIHLRDVGLLGRWWYEWPEATNVEQFRSAPIKKRYSLPKRVFPLYKSAEIHTKSVRSVPRSVLVLGAALLAFGFFSWRAVASISSKVAPPEKPPAAIATLPASSPSTRPASPVSTDPSASPVPERQQVVGCFSSAKTCRCFDKAGFPVTVEWELCRVSSVGYAGLVPLDLTPAPPPRSVPAALGASGPGAGGVPPGEQGTRHAGL